MAHCVGEIFEARVVIQHPIEDLAFVLGTAVLEIADGIHDERVLARQSAPRYVPVLIDPGWRHHIQEPLVDGQSDARYSLWHAVSVSV